jgi:nucleoside-diphosphate-sugar epimerase
MNLRLYSVYGPWEEPDRLIPRLIEMGKQGKYPPLVNPMTSRDFIYIDDCVHAFICAAININEQNILLWTLPVAPFYRLSLCDPLILEEPFIGADTLVQSLTNRCLY